MNWDQMKRNVGCLVQLIPTACCLGEDGRELPPRDDDWTIDQVLSDGVHVSNVVTGHTTIFGKDHVHHFTTNPDRSRTGILYGFLTLNVQVFLQGNTLWVRPNARPGEPVKAHLCGVVEKWVDFRYPFDSGLQVRLEADGYQVAWCLDTKLTRKIDLEGWEIVIEPDSQGVLTKFRVQDRPAHQTLIRRRNH